jgi:transcriptional regulator with XRE-family HTH domain
MTVGQCIKRLRAAAGLTQRELAARVELSAPMLSLIEADKRDPTVRLLRSVARELGLPSAVLLAAAMADDDAPASHDTRQLRKLTDQLLRTATTIVAERRLTQSR